MDSAESEVQAAHAVLDSLRFTMLAQSRLMVLVNHSSQLAAERSCAVEARNEEMGKGAFGLAVHGRHLSQANMEEAQGRRGPPDV